MRLLQTTPEFDEPRLLPGASLVTMRGALPFGRRGGIARAAAFMTRRQRG